MRQVDRPQRPPAIRRGETWEEYLRRLIEQSERDVRESLRQWEAADERQ